MDKNDANYNFSPYMNMNYENIGYDPMANDPNMFNPISQYEQAYMYYRYLSQQLEYKIRCKEYERLCSNNRTDNSPRSERHIE